MEKVLESLKTLSYSDLQEVGNRIVVLKRIAKDREKGEVDDKRQDTIDKVNGLIEKGEIVKGTVIRLAYRGKVVEATVMTVPSAETKNLRVESESFDTKDGARYADKYTFLEIV